MSYSLDFLQKGLGIRANAQSFVTGSSTITRWLNRIAPKTGSSRRRKSDKGALLKDVEQYPDAYQRERAARFGVCHQAIWQALKKLRITYKKTLHHPKANEQARRLFQEKIKGYKNQG